MFDTVHTERGCVQVKCFGKTLADFRVGERVVLHREPTAEEFAAFQGLHDSIMAEHAARGLRGMDLQIAAAADARTDPLYSGVRSDLADFEVRITRNGGFLHVRGNVLTGWDGSFDPSLPCVDTHGRPVPIAGVVGNTVEVRAAQCEYCSSH